MTVVVGGHTRNVGKTTAVCQIIRTTPGLNWTAIKISRHGHGADIATPIVEEEQSASHRTDTGRYLAAGASRAIWIRAQPEHTLSALAQVTAANRIIESTSVLDVLHPDLFVFVINPENQDWKPSALRHRDRADYTVQAPLSNEMLQSIRGECFRGTL